MTRKSISTNAAAVSCDVCGRTLLRGESADVFLHGGQRRRVCELCTARAVHEGWIREGLDDVLARSREGRPRRGSLLGRLRARRVDGAEPEPEPGVPAEAEEAPAPAAAPRRRVEPLPLPVPDQPAPAGDHRSVRGVPTNAELKVTRALEVFNSSAHTRTVAGVTRSLGAPIVSARPSATEGSVVTIVVGWELSWYRYEVDLADEASGVRVAAQGTELTELDPADQQPNAAAGEDGLLHPAASVA